MVSFAKVQRLAAGKTISHIEEEAAENDEEKEAEPLEKKTDSNAEAAGKYMPENAEAGEGIKPLGMKAQKPLTQSEEDWHPDRPAAKMKDNAQMKPEVSYQLTAKGEEVSEQSLKAELDDCFITDTGKEKNLTGASQDDRKLSKPDIWCWGRRRESTRICI